MGGHINPEGLWQSDKYPTCPAGKCPLSLSDPTAQDLLWEYAQRRRHVDSEFSSDLEDCLMREGFVPPIEDIVTDCPGCATPHIDLGEWRDRPHRKHLCASCGEIWQPSERHTRGVPFRYHPRAPGSEG